jgi:CBS domain-containing protein
MTRDVVTVREDTPYKAIAELMGSRKVSALPVLGPDAEVVGVVSEADLLVKAGYANPFDEVSMLERRRTRPKTAGSLASQLMTSPAVTIGPTETIAVAARCMNREKVKHLPVVDKFGELVGIVSRGDLLSIYVRPDDVIRDAIVADVFHRVLWVEPPEISVEVTDGIVTLEGQVEQRSFLGIAEHLCMAVEGVVGVVDKFTYDNDDRALRPLLGRS